MITWIFGNTGAGKTTHAQSILGAPTIKPMIHLDGDDMRETICSDLGFTSAERIVNNHRIASLAGLLEHQGFDIVVSVITPYQSTRKHIKQMYNPYFVYVEGGASDCERTPFEAPEPDEYDLHVVGNIE